MPQAQFDLGIFYRDGRGVTRDLPRAYMWFYLSAQGGRKKAEVARDALAHDLTASQRSKAEKDAMDYCKQQVKDCK